MTICSLCGTEIPAERVEALPNVTTCVNCSQTQVPLCLMDYSHKTAPSLLIIKRGGEDERKAIRAFKRRR